MSPSCWNSSRVASPCPHRRRRGTSRPSTWPRASAPAEGLQERLPLGVGEVGGDQLGVEPGTVRPAGPGLPSSVTRNSADVPSTTSVRIRARSSLVMPVPSVDLARAPIATPATPPTTGIGEQRAAEDAPERAPGRAALGVVVLVVVSGLSAPAGHDMTAWSTILTRPSACGLLEDRGRVRRALRVLELPHREGRHQPHSSFSMARLSAARRPARRAVGGLPSYQACRQGGWTPPRGWVGRRLRRPALPRPARPR